MESKIKKILKQMGFDVSLTGFELWVQLIKRVYEDMKYTTPGRKSRIVIEDYYNSMAVRNFTTRNSIERNLRTSVSDRKERIQQYFLYYDKGITNKRFLMLMIEELKRRGV